MTSQLLKSKWVRRVFIAIPFALIIVVIIGIMNLGHCWSCKTLKCKDSIECGYFCECRFNDYEFEGLCVEKEN